MITLQGGGLSAPAPASLPHSTWRWHCWLLCVQVYHHHHHCPCVEEIPVLSEMYSRQGGIPTGLRMISKLQCLLTKMQPGWQEKGDFNNFNFRWLWCRFEFMCTRCNNSRTMAMLCETPEWKESDLWIEATPPIFQQETSLAWRKQVALTLTWYLSNI